MKKITILIAVVTLFSVSVFGQAARQAIGVRGGYGWEVSYQHPFGEKNRLEFNLGLMNYGFVAAGTYDWTFDLSDELAPGFAWYVGAGAQLGAWRTYEGHGDWSPSSEFNVGIVGQIGLEYNFEDVPLQLSVDYRPGLMFLGNNNFMGANFALGVRYKLK